MEFSIHYHSDGVQDDILALPDTLAAWHVVLTRRMAAVGSNLGEPHTKAMGKYPFELRLKGAGGIARVFYCAQVDRRIVHVAQHSSKRPGVHRRASWTWRRSA